MLNTSIDTLPTPANLRIRNIPPVQTVWEQGNNKPLPQLLQGNAEHKVLTLRHDNIVNFIATNVSSKFDVFSDLPGMGPQVEGQYLLPYVWPTWSLI